MASGIRRSTNRPKSGKNVKSSGKTKRHKNNSESQKKYHEKISARRLKKKKK